MKSAGGCSHGTDTNAIETDQCNQGLTHGSTGIRGILGWARDYTLKQLLAQTKALFVRNCFEIPAHDHHDIDGRQFWSNLPKGLSQLSANPVPADSIPGIPD